MNLLERDPALQELEEGLERARNGNGIVVLVRGEAGIGKTSLVRKFVSDVADRVHVLWGACDDLVTAIPMGPLWDMADSEPGLHGLLEGDDLNAVFRGVRDLLGRRLRPTVLVIEDVQWADAATLDLIRFVGRRIDSTYGLVILTYRDGENPGDMVVRQTLGDLRLGTVARIQLQPLSRGAIEEMAGSVDVDEIVRLSGGNPFFVTELLAGDGEHVPQSISDSVQARLARLDDDAQNLARLVSVVPGAAEVSLLVALAGDVHGAMERCEKSGLLELEANSIRFRHELARRAVEVGLTGLVRRELNDRTLGVLESSGADIARLAHHAREAADPDAMLRILPIAARHAADMKSHHEAVRHLAALEPYLQEMSVDDLADHLDVWAWESHLIGSPGALEVADRAVAMRRELGDPVALARSLLNAATVAWSARDADSVDERFEQVVEVLESGEGAGFAPIFAEAAHLAMWRYEPRALALAERALVLNGEERNPTRIQALNVVGGVVSGRFPQGLDELTEAFGLAKELGLAYEAARTALNLSIAHYKNLELEGAGTWANIAIGLCDDTGSPEIPHLSSVYLAWVLFYRGELSEALRLASAVVDVESASWGLKHWAEVLVAYVMVRRGTMGGRERVMELWRQALDYGHLPSRGPAAVALGELAWLDGELIPGSGDEMLRLIDETLELGMKFPAALHSIWLVLGGWLSNVEGDISVPYRQLIDGDWEGAAVSFAAVGMPYERAMALSFGGIEDRLLALRILDELGAVPLATKIRRGLQDGGVKGVPRGPYRGRRSSELGLTPRQTEILGLLEDGLTNAEIADRLFLSVRTVEHHVSAILATLGASTRAEAVGLARSSVGSR